MIGAISCGRRKVCLTERQPSAQTTRRFRAIELIAHPTASFGLRGSRGTGRNLFLLLEVVAGRGDEDVVEGRVDQLQGDDLDPGVVERPPLSRDVGGAVLDLD